MQVSVLSDELASIAELASVGSTIEIMRLTTISAEGLQSRIGSIKLVATAADGPCSESRSGFSCELWEEYESAKLTANGWLRQARQDGMIDSTKGEQQRQLGTGPILQTSYKNGP